MSERGSYQHVRPSNVAGVSISIGYLLILVLGVGLSKSDAWELWLLGQAILAINLVQWFVLIHECGHKTLFASRTGNELVGHFAAYFAGVPFHGWRLVHHQHHRWTGWQDLDPTTEALVPRRLAAAERVILNVCWFCWIPLFSVLYRLNNFWNLPRLARMLPAHHYRRVRREVAILALLYALTVVVLGPQLWWQIFGVAGLCSLVFLDLILFSQHNHIPQKISGGERVQPHPPHTQDIYTRSLVFPRWFSLVVLLGFDSHELHHMYPRVPGYRLSDIDEDVPNAITWWRWILKAKRVPATVIMFQNRKVTGLSL